MIYFTFSRRSGVTFVIKYYEYIRSEQWYTRTAAIRKRNGGICECCNMRYGDSVHHRSYANLGNEKDEELTHLCTPCHREVHGKKQKAFFIWPNRRSHLILLQLEVKQLGLFDET